MTDKPKRARKPRQEILVAEIVPNGAAAGRPSLYSEAIGEEICERLSKGESLVTISGLYHMPALRTMMRWAKEHEDFGAKYMRAREAQAEFMDDMILKAAETANPVNAAAQRVKIDAYKWRAAKLAPKVYGDKLDLTSSDGSMTPKGLEDFYGARDDGK